MMGHPALDSYAAKGAINKTMGIAYTGRLSNSHPTKTSMAKPKLPKINDKGANAITTAASKEIAKAPTVKYREKRR